MNGAFSVDETALKLFNVELEQFATYVRLTKPEIKAREYLIQQILILHQVPVYLCLHIEVLKFQVFDRLTLK